MKLCISLVRWNNLAKKYKLSVCQYISGSMEPQSRSRFTSSSDVIDSTISFIMEPCFSCAMNSLLSFYDSSLYLLATREISRFDLINKFLCVYLSLNDVCRNQRQLRTQLESITTTHMHRHYKLRIKAGSTTHRNG